MIVSLSVKLSIITINYNNREGLQRTINSIIDQTWHDFEWIVIDGGSTDGSKELIEKYQKYFSYWCSEPDKGVYNAMNKGVVKAKGEYLFFLNSGDCLHDSKVLEKASTIDSDSDVFYGDICFVKKDGNFIFNYPEKLTTHYLLYRSLGHPACFIKAYLLNEKGYREDFKIISDWYCFIKWYREGKSFVHIPITVADFDTTGISSQNKDVLHLERGIMYEELFGKENRQWITESIDMQIMCENYDNPDICNMMYVRSKGGKRLKLLRFVMNLVIGKHI